MKSNSRPTNRIQIGPFAWHIKEDDKLSTVAQVSGAAVPDALTILLDPSLAGDTERETVIHESLHGIWNAALGLKSFPEHKEEKVVRALAPWLLMFLRDNEELVSWLQEQS